MLIPVKLWALLLSLAALAAAAGVAAADAQAADRAAPRVAALPSSGDVTGVRLRYRVRDDRGHTRETITVWRGNRRLVAITTSLAKVSPKKVYWVRWRPGFENTGRFRLCVIARDAAGKSSDRSCNWLTVRR